MLGPVLQHLGPLHPVEQVLTMVLAFGPFVVLALTIRLSRRRSADGSSEVGEAAEAEPGGRPVVQRSQAEGEDSRTGDGG